MSGLATVIGYVVMVIGAVTAVVALSVFACDYWLRNTKAIAAFVAFVRQRNKP